MYNVGDLVMVRNFEDIANDPHNIGTHAVPSFRCISFPPSMRELCGEILQVVQSANEVGEYRLKRESEKAALRWTFVNEFLEPAETKEIAGFSDDEIQVLLGGND